jgi:hypothetical protein
MKNSKTILAAIAFVALTITSCKKDDTSSPSVSLNGGSVVTLDLHQAYTEQGATANDSKDGDISSGIGTSGTVDVNNAGVYTITYSVNDKAGNAGEAKRTVIVRHTAATTEGNFAVKDSCGSSSTSYIDIANDETTTKLRVTRFANYDNATAYFEISGETNSTITVPQQTIVCGTIPVARVFKGSGNISPNGRKLTINYTEVTNNTSTSCTGIYNK